MDERIDYMLGVMSAYKEGKDIECRDLLYGDNGWVFNSEPDWNWYRYKYRVVKEELRVIAEYNGLQLSETLPEKFNWYDAKILHERYEGWRLPERWELTMLYDKCVASHTEDSFWSSTNQNKRLKSASLVEFYKGLESRDFCAHENSVRLVMERL